jgi:hypothetical protein
MASFARGAFQHAACLYEGGKFTCYPLHSTFLIEDYVRILEN